MDKNNLGAVRQTFASLVWTHKIHEKSADILSTKDNCSKFWNILVVSLVLISTIAQAYFPSENWISVSGVILTIIEFILLVITLTYSYGAQAERHKQFALRMLAIRDEYIAFIAEIMNGAKNIEEKRDSLKAKLDVCYQFAPQQVDGAYEAAKISLIPKEVEQTGDLTYSDQEIDRFLPVELRLSK